jgi:hypothetical protein
MTKENELPGAMAGGIRSDLRYRDLREWIEEARALGEIREVKGMSWQTDIGMAAEVLLHDENAPCVIFEDVPGTLPGSRVVVNFFGGQRQRMTLGFPTHLTKLELSEAFRQNLHGRSQTDPAALCQRRTGLRECHHR